MVWIGSYHVLVHDRLIALSVPVVRVLRYGVELFLVRHYHSLSLPIFSLIQLVSVFEEPLGEALVNASKLLQLFVYKQYLIFFIFPRCVDSFDTLVYLSVPYYAVAHRLALYLVDGEYRIEQSTTFSLLPCSIFFVFFDLNILVKSEILLLSLQPLWIGLYA